MVHDGPTSGFAPMHRRSDGKWAMVHDHSSFYPPAYDTYAPPDYVYADDQMAHLKVAILDLQRRHEPEEFSWAVEYHGDVTPDALPASWTASISGDVSAYLWADQGQDYLRFDTGASGSSRSLYYTLGGAGSTPWTDMDFGDGVVVELRVRVVDDATAQGAASVFLGDGLNGYLSLELTGDGVNLEGLGGNAGQVTFSESGNAGFSTAGWHTYRLVIELEAGLVLAELYLDGDHSQPILTQWLNPALVDEIRVGDQTSTNNGVWDLEFLRFAHHAPEPASGFGLAAFAAAVLLRRGSGGGR